METSAKTAMNVNEIFMAIGKFHWFITTEETLDDIWKQQCSDISMRDKCMQHFAATFLRASMWLSISVKDVVECTEELCIFSLDEL